MSEITTFRIWEPLGSIWEKEQVYRNYSIY